MTGVKNPYLLLEVAKSMPKVKFVMAGGGDLLQEVREISPENVSVIGWTDASTFWSAVDCAISTSDNEGMPIALIEAQLAGVPVITTDVGSSSEVVVDGVTGITTDKNRESLMRGLKVLIENRELFQSMSITAATVAEENFNREKMLSHHNKLYSDLRMSSSRSNRRSA